MDKKAKDILFKTYWKNGWIPAKDRKTDPADFEYAKSKGLMFDAINITHDQCVEEILSDISSADKISIEKVSKAFLSSLSNGRLDWRSAIASFAAAKRLPKHTFQKTAAVHGYDAEGKINFESYTCGICGSLNNRHFGNENYQNEDLNVLNFERIKWGGVRHGYLIYTLFDLRIFCTEEITEPTLEDINIFKEILKTIETSQENDYPSKLSERLSRVIKSTKNERNVLMEIMACAEILKPLSHDRPASGRHDWNYMEYWRGEDKYNKEAVNKYFGKYL